MHLFFSSSFFFEMFPILSDCHHELGLTIGKNKLVVVVEHFSQVSALFVCDCGFRVVSQVFFNRFLDFEMIGGSLWNMMALFSEILTKMNFKDEIQFKWGKVVMSSFEKFPYFRIVDNKWIE